MILLNASASLSLSKLKVIPGVDECYLDMEFLSAQLWSFLGRYALGDAIYQRRIQLVNWESYT